IENSVADIRPVRSINAQVNAETSAVACHGRQLRRVSEHFGGDTSDVEAGATKGARVNDRNFFIVPIWGDNGITGSGTDDGQIVFFDAHAISVVVPNPVMTS